MPLATQNTTATWARLHAMRLIRAALHPNPGPVPAPQTGSTPGGIIFDRYVPKKPVGKTVLLIYGIALAGEKDPRVMRFAHALAESGLQVIVPALAGLKSYDATIEDIATIEALAIHFAKEDSQPIGVTAFSIGGGLALCAATNPKAANSIDPLLVFGAYHTLPNVAELLQTQAMTSPKTDGEWDDFIWGQMVLAYRTRDTVNLQPEEKAGLEERLLTFCDDPLAPKRTFYEKVLKHHNFSNIEDLRKMPQLEEQLSPRGKLGGVQARVMVFHDPEDRLVFSTDAKKIFDELNQTAPPGRHKMLVTPWITHVTPHYAWKIFDIFKIMEMMSTLFRR